MRRLFMYVDPDQINAISCFDTAQKVMEGDSFDFNSVDHHNRAAIVYFICAFLSQELDNKNTSHTDMVGDIICTVDLDCLTAILGDKNAIGISRMVRHDLDVNPHWQPFFGKLNANLPWWMKND